MASVATDSEVLNVKDQPGGEARGFRQIQRGPRAIATTTLTAPPPSTLSSMRHGSDVIEVTTSMQQGSTGPGRLGVQFDEEEAEGEDSDDAFEKDDKVMKMEQHSRGKKRHNTEESPLIVLGADERMISWLGFDEYCRILQDEPNGWLQGIYGGDDLKERIYKSTMKQGRQECAALYVEKEYESLALEALQHSFKTNNLKRPRYSCKYCQKDFKDKNTLSFHRMRSECPSWDKVGSMKMYPIWHKGEAIELARLTKLWRRAGLLTSDDHQSFVEPTAKKMKTTLVSSKSDEVAKPRGTKKCPPMLPSKARETPTRSVKHQKSNLEPYLIKQKGEAGDARGKIKSITADCKRVARNDKEKTDKQSLVKNSSMDSVVGLREGTSRVHGCSRSSCTPLQTVLDLKKRTRATVEADAQVQAATFTADQFAINGLHLPEPVPIPGLFILINETGNVIDHSLLESPDACARELVDLDVKGVLNQSLTTAFGNWYLSNQNKDLRDSQPRLQVVIEMCRGTCESFRTEQQEMQRLEEIKKLKTFLHYRIQRNEYERQKSTLEETLQAKREQFVQEQVKQFDLEEQERSEQLKWGWSLLFYTLKNSPVVGVPNSPWVHSKQELSIILDAIGGEQMEQPISLETTCPHIVCALKMYCRGTHGKRWLLAHPTKGLTEATILSIARTKEESIRLTVAAQDIVDIGWMYFSRMGECNESVQQCKTDMVILLGYSNTSQQLVLDKIDAFMKRLRLRALADMLRRGFFVELETMWCNPDIEQHHIEQCEKVYTDVLIQRENIDLGWLLVGEEMRDDSITFTQNAKRECVKALNALCDVTLNPIYKALGLSHGPDLEGGLESHQLTTPIGDHDMMMDHSRILEGSKIDHLNEDVEQIIQLLETPINSREQQLLLRHVEEPQIPIPIFGSAHFSRSMHLALGLAPPDGRTVDASPVRVLDLNQSASKVSVVDVQTPLHVEPSCEEMVDGPNGLEEIATETSVGLANGVRAKEAVQNILSWKGWLGSDSIGFIRRGHYLKLSVAADLVPLEQAEGLLTTDLMEWFRVWYNPQIACEDMVICSPHFISSLRNHAKKNGEAEDNLRVFVLRKLKSELSKGTFIVPILDADHWTVVVLNAEYFMHFDSLRNANIHGAGLLHRLLAKTWVICVGHSVGSPHWKRAIAKSSWLYPVVPQQCGDWDCGFYVLQFIISYYMDILEKKTVERKLTRWFSHETAVSTRGILNDSIVDVLRCAIVKNSEWEIIPHTPDADDSDDSSPISYFKEQPRRSLRSKPSKKRKISENNENKQKQQVVSSQACRKAKRTREFEDVRSKITGAFVIQRKRCHENICGVSLDAIPGDYLRIYHGTVAVQDKASKEIVLVVQFTSFDQMSEEGYEEYEKLTTTLISLKSGASFIKHNGAQREGEMYALGWRAGTYKGLFFSRYVPSRKMQKNASTLHKWKQDQELVLWISSVYGKKFRTLAPTVFQLTEVEIAKVEVPSLSQTEFDISHEEESGFCSNLTYTVKDFSNKFHKDKDYNSYAYGIWAPIHSDSGKLAKKKIGFVSEGGEFLLGSYKVFVDFNACDGIVEILWRGKTDFHSTISSTTTLDYTRVGTSVQVNEGLVQRMKKLVNMQENEGVDITKKVHGVKQIFESKLNPKL